MPALALFRILFSIVSLAVLAASAYLLWSWYDGALVRAPDGDLVRIREDWRLWTGAGLLALSFLGRLPLLFLLGSVDTDPMKAERLEGRKYSRPDGSCLYIEMTGPADAQPIILTHGWSLDSRMWFYARRELSKRFRVIVWDLPGLGRSSRDKSHDVSLTEMARELQAVIELSCAKSPVLVGHSIGGMIIQTFARDNPARFNETVSGVVLLNTTYTNPLRTMIFSPLMTALRWPLIEPMMRLTVLMEPFAWLNAWQSYLSGWAHVAVRFGFGSEVTRSQLDTTTLLLTRARPGTSARGNLAMFRWDATGAIADIKVPVLVVGGERDIVTKLQASRSIAAEKPDAWLVSVPGANHMGPVGQAELYNREIAAFAEKAKPVVPPVGTVAAGGVARIRR